MAGVPLSDTEVIVIESRRSTGYDSGSALLAEGVLVYTVDAGVSSGLLPIKLAGDPGNAHLDDYPLLAVGESVDRAGLHDHCRGRRRRHSHRHHRQVWRRLARAVRWSGRS